jgi:hypothetical protein
MVGSLLAIGPLPDRGARTSAQYHLGFPQPDSGIS